MSDEIDAAEIARRERERAYKKAWYEANAEKQRAKNRAWYEANVEKIRARQKAWYEANPDKQAACNKAWRDANAEKIRDWNKANAETIRARQKAWREANPDWQRVYNKKRTDTLHHSYLAHLLGLPAAEIPPDLLAAKREQLTLRRLARTLKEALNESSKDTDRIPGHDGRGGDTGRSAPHRGEQSAGAGAQGNQRHRRGGDGQGARLDQQQSERRDQGGQDEHRAAREGRATGPGRELGAAGDRRRTEDQLAREQAHHEEAAA